MSEEREMDELEDEYEDLDEMDSIDLNIEEFSDLAGLEERPENQQVGFSDKDVVVTYGAKVEDEISRLEVQFAEKEAELKYAEPEVAIREFSDLLNTSKILEANEITAKISAFIAKLLSSINRHHEATEYYLQSVSESRKSGNKNLHLLYLTPFGLNLMHFEPRDASVVFGQAIKLADELSDKEAYAVNTTYFADCLPLSEKNQKLNLFSESKSYYESTSNIQEIGKINSKIGKLYYEFGDYSSSFEYLSKSVQELVESDDKELVKSVVSLFRKNQKLLFYGHSLKYRLELPTPEPIKETQNIKKIFQIISDTGAFDIIRGLHRIENIEEPTKEKKFDSIKYLLSNSLYHRQNEQELKQSAEILEEIGELFLKDDCLANTFYNFIGSLILFKQANEKKLSEKLEKKIEKVIEKLVITLEPSILFNLQIYSEYQLALGLKDINQKLALNYTNSCIGTAKKRNYPLYEALCKEIIAEIKSADDIDKAAIEYESAITIFQEMEDKIDLLRLFEKYGDMMIPVHQDRGRELLNRAKEIATELGDKEIISRIQEKL